MNRWIPLLLLPLALSRGTLCAASATPGARLVNHHNGKAVEQVPVRMDGRTIRVWNSDAVGGGMTFKSAGAVAVPQDGKLYLQIAYVDNGYGRLNVQLTAKGGNPVKPDRFLGLSRSNSGRLVSARMRFAGIQAAGVGELSVCVNLDRSRGESLAVESVVLQETPFGDANFSYVITDPWEGPYKGPRVKPRDNSTLKGKVMTGYQGWFRTPNDPEGGGWTHWGNIHEGTFSIDMWPDVSQYPAACLDKAADIKLKSGKPAYLFSSAWPAVVDTHFKWMRQHDIDGAFVQRFVSDRFNSVSGGPEWVLANVRAAANREGRIWAVEYDISGYPDGKLLETLKTDWKWFVDRFRVLDDPAYAREGGKPVVFIWGLPFPNRNISPATANAVVDFFRNDPKYGNNHVIGGIPGNWRTMSPEWQEHFKKYQCVLSWMSLSYAEDVTDFGKLGQSYYAHVKPGFSWANLKHLPTGDDTFDYSPRDGGRPYMNQITKAVEAGADRLFVGMFDEYDEGTAIMPMSDDHPPTPVRPGVAATFYNGTNAQEQGEFVRLPAAELDLGTTAPGKRTAAENFFARMGGCVVFPKAGKYMFSIEGAPGDDAELILNGKKILVARNISGAVTATEPITVNAGASMPYRLEYRHRTGAGKLRLLWETPGNARLPVPPEALQDAWGRFITNEGQRPDHWLELTRKGKELMNARVPVHQR